MINFLISYQAKVFIEVNYWFFFVVVAVFGAIFGSFFDMLTYRLPNNLSIISPGSFCPVCKNQLKWYSNIPIFSYIFLGGKCASCKTKIPIRYLLLEIVTTLLFIGVYQLFIISDFMTVGDFLRLETLMLMSIPIFVIDAKHKLIPTSLTILGAILAISLSKLSIVINIKSSIIGLFVGVLILFLIRFVANKVYKREAMGEGDVWLMGMLGAYTGWFGIPLIMFVSSFTGIVVGIIYMKIFKDDEIPFGPFLLIGAWTYIIIDYLLGKEVLLNIFTYLSFF